MRDSESDNESSVSKKEVPEKSRPLTVYQKPRPVVAGNSLPPLRAVLMDDEEASNEGTSSSSRAKESLDKSHKLL
jgi:hypothetical protein